MIDTSASLSARYFADLIGKPFLRGGRGPEGYDCWGVLQEVQRRLGNSPTDFPTDPTLLMQAISDEWMPLERYQAKPGDGVLLRSANAAYVWHIGVMVGPFKMLHAREGAGVCTERVDSPAYLRRICGFYRFRGRA